MKIKKHHARLLQHSFSKAEWEYLCANERFMGEWQKCTESLDDFERLLRVAVGLLDEWEHSQLRLIMIAWKLTRVFRFSAWN